MWSFWVVRVLPLLLPRCLLVLILILASVPWLWVHEMIYQCPLTSSLCFILEVSDLLECSWLRD